MKKQIILIGFVLISFCSFSGAKWIPVNIIFDSTVSVIDMKVLSYEGDTILKYYDLSDSTVKEFDCKSKKYSLIKIRDKSLNPLNKSWYGEFPVSGEIVKLIQFKYGSRTRYVFAKQIGNYYKVWFPLDIPFATYLFKVSNNPIYIYPKFCFEYNKKAFLCSDFYMKKEDFNLEIKN